MIFPIGTTDTTESSQPAILAHVGAMKREGHAIAYDSTEDCAAKFIASRVTHFRTCVKCKLALDNNSKKA